MVQQATTKQRQVALKLKSQTVDMCDLPQRPQSDIAINVEVKPESREIDWTGCCGNVKDDFLQQRFSGRFTNCSL
jgi:hypothetical protein